MSCLSNERTYMREEEAFLMLLMSGDGAGCMKMGRWAARWFERRRREVDRHQIVVVRS